MLKNIFRMNVVLIVLFILSCGKSGPSSPDTAAQDGNPDRFAEDFPAKIQLFGDTYPAATSDIAEVLQGPGYVSEDDWGIPWVDDNPSGEKWAVVVSRVIKDDVACIEFRFVGEAATSGHLSNVMEALDESEDLIEGDIRFPRVAACFFEDGDDSFVEVTIVFQWREDEEECWSIRVVRYMFDPDDFDTSLSAMGRALIGDHIIDLDLMWGDMMPDVDYDPRGPKGDLWVCFTRWTNMFETTTNIYMVKGTRVQEVYYAVGWGNDGEAVAFVIANDDNGWLPRIAIGKCEIFELSEDWNMAIAYTIQKYVFYTAFAYCDVDWDGNQLQLYQFTMTHWVWPGSAGGCPMIDIGPPGTNYAAAVWTQTRTEGLNDVTISYGDNRGGYAVLHTEPGEDKPGSCMGSIAIHNISGDIESSISYIRNFNVEQNYDWQPYAILFEADVNGGEQSFTETERQISEDEISKWDVGSLQNHYYGMSTALIVYNYSYWMVWSAYTSGTTPDEVWGTYGYVW